MHLEDPRIDFDLSSQPYYLLSQIHVLMNVNNQTVLVTIDLHCIAKKTRLEMFHRRKSHTSLKQKHFWVNYPFKYDDTWKWKQADV